MQDILLANLHTGKQPSTSIRQNSHYVLICENIMNMSVEYISVVFLRKCVTDPGLDAKGKPMAPGQ